MKRDCPIHHRPCEPADKLRVLLCANGYTDLRQAGATLCALQHQLFTTGLAVDLTAEGYGRRYCYETRDDAFRALQAWDGTSHPRGPWIKCKGAGIDILNPEIA